jgi:hypothetical protein
MLKNFRNSNKVPVKTWNKWSLRARYTFNTLYEGMKANPLLFLAPSTPEPTKRQWKVTAWNAAWIAADAIREYDREFHKDAV